MSTPEEILLMSDVRDAGQSSAGIPGLQQQEEFAVVRRGAVVVAADEGWRRSSYCSGANSMCVEVALAGAAARVRDTKRPDGSTLAFGTDAWGAFVRHVSHPVS